MTSNGQPLSRQPAIPYLIQIHSPQRQSPPPAMNGIVESIAENIGINEVNNVATKKIGQKNPYGVPLPQGLSKHDADVLRRCRRRAHQLDHNAVLCYCCPCFFGLNTAICLIPILGPIWANSLSGRVIRMAEDADIPATLQAKMTANITFDFLVHSTPGCMTYSRYRFHPSLAQCSRYH